MRAADLMTTHVITVPPDTPLHVVAGIMAERGVTGVPVVDDAETLLGLVTESDLLHRLAAVEAPRHGYLWGVFHSISHQADEYARSHGHRADDVMTLAEDLVTATEDTTAEHVARVMEEKRIRHVPIVRDGRKLAGMVTRASLLRAALIPPEYRHSNAPDNVIRHGVLRAMREKPWADTHFTFVDVKDGVVTFSGFARNEHVKRGLRVIAEEVEGVRSVQFETMPTPSYWIAAP